MKNEKKKVGDGRVEAYTTIKKAARKTIKSEAKKQSRSYAGQLRVILETYAGDRIGATA